MFLNKSTNRQSLSNLFLLQKLFLLLFNISMNLLIDQRRVLITTLIYIFTLRGNWTGTSTGKHSFMWNVRDRSRVPLFLKGVFPKWFRWISLNSVTKISVITVKGLKPATQSPLVLETRMLPQCHQDTCRDRIFKLSPIHASVIFRFPEFIESPPLFRKNSIVPVPFPIPPRSRSRAVLISYQCQGWTPYGIPITNLHPKTALFAQARHLPP